MYTVFKLISTCIQPSLNGLGVCSIWVFHLFVCPYVHVGLLVKSTYITFCVGQGQI